MTRLLWAILLVLIGIAFPMAWVVIVPVLALMFVTAILGGAVNSIFAPLVQCFKPGLHRASFRAHEDELFKMLVRAISINGYKIDNVNRETGLVTFKTVPSLNTVSGHEGSAIVIPKSEDICDVQINLSFEGQFTDWGDGEKIANRILETIGQAFERIDTEEKPVTKVFSEEEKVASVKEDIKQLGLVAGVIIAVIVVTGIVFKIRGSY